MPQLKLENSLVDERYEVRERLSLGSYAEIFVARDRQKNGQEIVIKALNAHLQGTPDADLENTLIENFQNEALALDAVRHPHIILRLGHGTAADLNGVPFHYQVLEYMPGGDLLRLCRTCPGNALDLQAALSYFKQVCEALAYAHSKGVIHRDLKPNNFLLSRDHRTLKVADFGVAKITSDDNAEITRVGADIYAPPEHHPDEAHGHIGRLTASADIYSLAKSFYTIVSGRTPSEFIRRPITFLPNSINAQPWAENLLTVLRRATAIQASERQATVIEFWSALASVATLATLVTNNVVVEDDATRIKPKAQVEVAPLEIAPSGLPAKPQQPEFTTLVNNPVPVATAEKKTEAAPVPDKRKIVVNFDLPKVEKPAVINTEKAKPPVPSTKRAAVEPPPTPIESFMAPVWRRVVVAVVALLFLALLVTVYRYARERRASSNTVIPVALPGVSLTGKQAEVLTDNLYVRQGPGMNFATLGAVTKGSKHKILNSSENGWLQIEVNEWSPNEPHVPDQKQGWVNSNSKLVTITSRGWF